MQSGEGRTDACSARALVVPCRRCTVTGWLGPFSRLQVARHPNTNATTTIITTVAKITAWMMSPLVMVDRVAANERDPGGTMFQPGSPPSPKAPWANSSGTVSGSHGKIELGATFNWAAWKVSHLETRGLR